MLHRGCDLEKPRSAPGARGNASAPRRPRLARRRLLVRRRPQGDPFNRGARAAPSLSRPSSAATPTSRLDHRPRRPDRGVASHDPRPRSARSEISERDLLTADGRRFRNRRGSMAADYALHDGESAEVAGPLRSSTCPASSAAPALDVRRRLFARHRRSSTPWSAFAIGQKPTGAKDPYGLRRVALGGCGTDRDANRTRPARRSPASPWFARTSPASAGNAPPTTWPRKSTTTRWSGCAPGTSTATAASRPICSTPC